MTTSADAPEIVDGTVSERAGPTNRLPRRRSDAELVGYAPAPLRASSTAIVAGASAADRIAAATEIATQLDHVIKQQGLRTKIGQRRVTRPDGRTAWEDNFHIDIEAWQTLAAFLELAVVPVWTRRVIDPATGEPERVTYTVRREHYARETTKRDIANGNAIVERVETAEVDGYSWEARVEVFKDGTLVSAGEAMVSRTEESWRSNDEHAVRSMAQTRASSKAISGVARWIVTLAGYSGTPEAHAANSDASEELRAVFYQALAYLLDGDTDVIQATLDRLTDNYEAPPPAAALQAVVITAKAIKDQREKAAAAAVNAKEKQRG